MTQKTIVRFLFCLVLLSLPALSQHLEDEAYRPGIDPNIDMFLGSWKESMPRHTHGSLVERDILTKGNPENPTQKGAVLLYVNRFTYATLEAGGVTQPTTLEGEQEILYILSGKGVVTAGSKSADLHKGVCVFVPANRSFSLQNTGETSLTMYLISEPVPSGFQPISDVLVRDEGTIPIMSTDGHWCHIVKMLFTRSDGLGALQNVLTVAFDPMTIGQPHSHGPGTEEVWTAITGTSVAFLGKQIRWHPPGTAYLIPPNGNTPHSNINVSDEQIKMFYFLARPFR
jgi:mannose-6-phosphate isomerase-like protein (cupin superfamily)